MHLDGREVPVKRDGVTPHGFVMKINGQGMPTHNFPSGWQTNASAAVLILFLV